MGSFSHAGKTILIRNHENSPGADLLGPFWKKDNELLHKINKNKIYDFGKGEEIPV